MKFNRDTLLHAGFVTAEEAAASDALFKAECARILMAAQDRIMRRIRTEGSDGVRAIMEAAIAPSVAELDALTAAVLASFATLTQ